jgi:hypothetical protein
MQDYLKVTLSPYFDKLFEGESIEYRKGFSQGKAM